MKEIPNSVRQETECRNLAFDYALGISMLGLIPISGLLTLKLVVAIGLIGKMIWDIGSHWGFPRGQDFLALAGYVFGCLGAFALAFMAWLTFLAIGLYISYLGSLKIAAALFTLTWMLGQSTNQFYASGWAKLARRQSEI